jgi:uncharacterized membrane protein YhaH (DUF805 family)
MHNLRMRRSSFALWVMVWAFVSGLAFLTFRYSDITANRAIGNLLSNFLYAVLALGINKKRLHDLNATGWWAILAFIPFVSTLFTLYLVLVRGSVGANSYGLDPRETSE